MNPKILIIAIPLLMVAMMLQPVRSFSKEGLPYLYDRETGIPTSQFGTYIRKSELLIYPFYEYYRDHNFEYKPAELGYGLDQDFRGRYRANEGLIFIGYGISDRLAAEFEAGVIEARLDKSDKDTSAAPARIEESGLSDVEGQIRWRWNPERAGMPEFFSYFETVFPTGKENSLIGTSDWEFKIGSGMIKGFSWGTVTLRVAVDYSAAEKSFGVGEYALEYLKRISDRFRFFFMLEGTEDEVALVPEIQWHFSHSMFLKVNSGFGVTSKATDFAPEAGIMISLWP